MNNISFKSLAMIISFKSLAMIKGLIRKQARHNNTNNHIHGLGYNELKSDPN